MKNLLNKWLGGDATWNEEKKLRQTTAQDDFLKEAIEGYDAFPNSDHTAAIDRLNARLPKRKQQKGLFVTLPKIAAAAAVIGLIGTLFWLQQQVAAPPVLSQHSPQVTTPAPVEATESTSKLNLEAPAANERIAAAEQTPPPAPTEKVIRKEKTRPLPVQKKKITPKPVIVEEIALAPIAYPQEDYATVEMDAADISATPEPIVADEGIISMEVSDAVVERIVTAPASEVEMANEADFQNARVVAPNAPAAVMAQKKTRAASKLEAPAAAPLTKVNYYVGQVQNEDGQPLHDVKIVGLNTSFKTVSKLSGDFVLETNMPLTQIAVSKDGFHTRDIAINQYSDFLNVSLVKKTTKIPDSEEMLTLAPKPVDGFVQFYDYLAKNTVYPKGMEESQMEWEVEVRFYIDDNGTPTDLKVNNPDVYGFDKEAIRLLKNGPKWQPVNSHARYYVPFEK